MTKLDATDEEVAKAVVKRLKDMDLRSLRRQEDRAPISRGTLARWRKGDYEMQQDTRNACLIWLGVPLGILTTSYADGLREAMRRYEEYVNNALEEAKKEIQTLVDTATATPSPSVGAHELVVDEEMVSPYEGVGEIGGDDET